MKCNINSKIQKETASTFVVNTNIVAPVQYDMEELEAIKYSLKFTKDFLEYELKKVKDKSDIEEIKLDLEDIETALEKTDKALNGCSFNATESELKETFPGFKI